MNTEVGAKVSEGGGCLFSLTGELLDGQMAILRKEAGKTHSACDKGQARGL